jgi:hypothetical protein
VTASSWRTLNHNETCPVCHSEGWCRVSPDAAIVACRRKESPHKREYSDGSEAWLHYLAEPDPSLKGEAQERKPLSPEEIARRNNVYSALLDLLPLNARHRENLLARGLTDEAIANAGYASLPASNAHYKLSKLLDQFTAQDIVTTPGFGIVERLGSGDEKYTKRAVELSHTNGILVPIRTLDGSIVALKVRRDAGDPRYVYLSMGDNGPGSHVHVPTGPRTPTVRVTEGELKADVATLLSGELTISVPGVNSWRTALAVVNELTPELVVVAFDSDKAQNEHVSRAERRLINALLVAGFEVEVEEWSDHKGIDDALLAGATITRQMAQRAIEINDGDAAVALVEYVEEAFDLGVFNGEPHASPRTGPRRALAIADMHDYLTNRFYRHCGFLPRREHVNAAISALRDQARETGENWSLPIRAGRSPDGAIVLDMCRRATSDAIVIRPGKWRIERSPLVWRDARALEIPTPLPGGSIEEFRSVINVSEKTWPLVVGWLVAAMIPDIPHPIAYLVGPQGSAKTTTSRFLTMLIDPQVAESRSQVKDPADWAALGIGAYAVNLDNVSTIPAWLSDALCRAVTGDAYTPRAFYTQDQTRVLKFKLAMVMSTIDVGNIRGDLADRMLPIALEPIPDSRRTTEALVKRQYDEMRPRVLGALLDLVSQVLEALPTTKLDSMPRMSDFALVLKALDGITGMGSLGLYLETRDDLAAQVVEGDPIAMFVRDLVYDKKGNPKQPWEGSLQDLLELIQRHAQTGDLVLRYQITSERGVSSTLERSSPALGKIGVVVTKQRRRLGTGRSSNKQTFITIAAESGPQIKAAPLISSEHDDEPY